MPAIGQQQQVEILIGLDEFIYHQKCVVGWDIGIGGAVRQEQFSLEIPGERLIRLLTGERGAAAARRAGVPFVMEGYIDLDYDAKGSLILERAKKARDPEDVAARAVTLATEGKVPVRDGGWLPLGARSVCVHGDADNAPAIARTVRERLLRAGVEVAPLRALL